MVAEPGLIPGLEAYSVEFMNRARARLPALDRLLAMAANASTTPAGQMRIRRARDFAAASLATFEHKIPTADICMFWSKTADALLQEAFHLAHAEQPLEGEITLFAYGKLGARELNLSSDVDLLLVSDREEPKIQDWLRRFRELLQDVTELGFAFRLDFDLRPGGRFGPVVPTKSQFEDYFFNYGEAWERLAFVRFRPVCGSKSMADECLRASASFTYRKHLDFTLLEDLKVLRQRLHEQNWRRSENGALDLKLGLGGIRDLELFVHTQQVIHGGRDPGLRQSSTEAALRALQQRKVLGDTETEFLIRHYWNLRHAENLLQAATDRQIQVLPATDYLTLLPAGDRAALRKEMDHCQELVTELLGPVDLRVHSLPEDPAEQHQWLRDLGYSEGGIARSWESLIKKNALSRQAERDELYRRRFLSEMCERMARLARDRDLALEILNDFLRSIRAKATFFHLLLQKPELLDRLAHLFSSSSYLSRILIQRPELLDSFLYQAQGSRPDDEWDQFMSFWLERKLLTELTAGLDFLTDRDLPAMLARISGVADEIVLALLQKLNQEHGTRLDVIAMGKWGGRELGLRSDLDLVLITPESPNEKDMRVARRLISRLTEVQKGGALYELDFRLKPQGKGGPLLTSETDLQTYLEKEAEPWERQAYLKSRRPSQPCWEKRLHKACLSRTLTESDAQELEKIHQGLLQKSKGPGDLKYAPGGLVETEFSAQLRRLFDGQIPSGTNTLTELQALGPAWTKVLERYVSLRQTEQILRLISSNQQYELSRENEDALALAALEQTSFVELSRRIRALLEENAALLGPLDPRPRQG